MHTPQEHYNVLLQAIFSLVHASIRMIVPSRATLGRNSALRVRKYILTHSRSLFQNNLSFPNFHYLCTIEGFGEERREEHD